MKIFELGHVVLYVSHLKTSADFYKETLGFREIHRDLHTALYSSGRTHHELLLIEVGGQKEAKQYPDPGLYHIGFKVGNSHEELVAVHKELLDKGVTISGSADHHVTHSLYILDPDGNELELYVDIGDEWKRDERLVLKPTKKLTLE